MTEQHGSLAGKCGVYKITFPNGSFYIGQALNLQRRKNQHLKDSIKQKHSNDRFQKCFNKYGDFTFEVLEECEKCDLNITETKYISKGIDDENCINMCSEGRSRVGIKSSDETKKKISDYQKLVGKTKPVYMFSRDNMDLLTKFDSIREAEISIGCHPKDVQKSCKSNGKYNVKGYKFMYAYKIDNMVNHIKEIITF